MKTLKISKDIALKIALSQYLGEKCRCGKEFSKIEDLEGAVFDPHETGRISHEKCYKENKDGN